MVDDTFRLFHMEVNHMSARTITLLAEKGGVGRTTLTVNLAGAFARRGYRVLLVDMEGQASASKLFLGPDAVDRLPVHQMLGALFDEAADANPQHIIRATRFPGIQIAPSSGLLFRYEQGEPLARGMVCFALRDFLADVVHDFDVILVDTPPMIRGLIGVSSVLAADAIITPIEPEPFAMQAIVEVHRLITALQEAMMRNGLPRDFRHLGCVITKKDRKSLHKAVEQSVRNNYGTQVFTSIIRDLAAYADANASQSPVTDYAPKTKSAQAKVLEATTEVNELCSELETRLGFTLAPASKSKSKKVA